MSVFGETAPVGKRYATDRIESSETLEKIWLGGGAWP